MGQDMASTVARTVYDCERAAAHAADGMAEFAAEEERHYQSGWAEGRRAADLTEEARDARADALAILSDLRAARRALAGRLTAEEVRICERLRSRAEGLIDDWRAARAQRDNLIAEWTGHSGFANAYGEGRQDGARY
jgi:hypothetical protein